MGVIGGSYLFGFLFDNEKAKDIATDMAETLLIGGLLFTELSLKNVVGRARPEALKGTFRLDPFWGSGRRSLPSGHATAEIAADFAVDGTNIYDLGCSTCTTFLHLQHLDVVFPSFMFGLCTGPLAEEEQKAWRPLVREIVAKERMVWAVRSLKNRPLRICPSGE